MGKVKFPHFHKMTHEEYQRDVFQKLERFVNIQNQRNLIFEKYLSKFKVEFPPNINTTYNIVNTTWIGFSIILGCCVIALAIGMHK